MAEILARNPDFWGILLTGGMFSLVGFLGMMCLFVPNRYSVPFMTWLARIENFPYLAGPVVLLSLVVASVMLGIAASIAFKYVSIPTSVWILFAFGLLGTVLIYVLRRRSNTA